MKFSRVLLSCLVMLGWSSIAQAASISIRVDKDVALDSPNPNNNYNNQIHRFLWVGDNNVTGSKDEQGMFGFNVTALTGLLGGGQTLIVDSMTFRAFNNFQGPRGADAKGNVDISLGNTDVWDVNAVTYNNSANNHGATIASAFLSAASVNSYASWDVTSLGSAPLLDGYVTFYLTTLPGANPADVNYHDFEAEEFGGSDNAAFLDIDYRIVSVPAPPALALLALGAVGLIARRRGTAATKS